MQQSTLGNCGNAGQKERGNDASRQHRPLAPASRRPAELDGHLRAALEGGEGRVCARVWGGGSGSHRRREVPSLTSSRGGVF